VEGKTGMCVFESTWHWSGVSFTEGICKLVLTFFQISRDIGTKGEVTQVRFEIPKDPERVQMNPPSFTSRKFHSSVHKKQKKKETAAPMLLSCVRNEDIIVAVFHESTDDIKIIKDFGTNILNSFDSTFGRKLKKFLKSLDDSDTEEHKNSQEIMAQFEGFRETVESMRTKINVALQQQPILDENARSILLPIPSSSTIATNSKQSSARPSFDGMRPKMIHPLVDTQKSPVKKREEVFHKSTSNNSLGSADSI